jgi:hypothetical protein
MKKLLVIIVLSLCFIIPSQADDIRDFQVEGMSIGDSVLDYLPKNKIKKKMSPNKKIKIVRASKKDNLEIYDNSQVWWYDEDKDYKIVGLAGELKFDNDIKGCRKKQKEIVEDIKSLFSTLTVRESENKNMHDKTGKSKVFHYYFKFPNGDTINIQCYMFSKDFKKKNAIDNLKVMIVTKKMNDHYRDAR